jgi:hypothetical protein
MRARGYAILIFCLAALMTGVYAKFQRRIIAGDGLGWDGKSYFALYSEFRGVELASPVQYPFCKRTALPFLAAALPLEPASAFISINVVAGFLSVLVTYAALRRKVSPPAALLSVLPLVFYLYSPIRFPFFYPFYVDPPAMLLYAAAAYCLARRWPIGAVVAILMSGFFREAAIYYAAVLAGAAYLLRWISRTQLVWLGGAGAAAVAAQMWAYAGPCAGSQLMTVAESTFGPYGKLDSFTGAVRTLAALSMAVGAFVPLLRDAARREYDDVAAVSGVLLVLSIVFAVFGGSDTTRIMYVAFPLYAIYLASLVEASDKLRAVVLAVAGLLANSFAKRIPEPAAYAPNNDLTGLFAFSPEYAHIGIAAALLVYWMLMAQAVRLVSVERLATLRSRASRWLGGTS